MNDVVNNPIEKIRRLADSWDKGRAIGINTLHEIRKVLAGCEGLACVPLQPTQKMLDHARIATQAANFYVQGEQPRKPEVQESILLSAAYKAMINAAQEPSE